MLSSVKPASMILATRVLMLFLLANVWLSCSGYRCGFRQEFPRLSSTKSFNSPNSASDFFAASPCTASAGQCEKRERYANYSGSNRPRSKTYRVLMSLLYESGVEHETCLLQAEVRELTANVILSKALSMENSEKSSQADILASFGGCFLVSCALLCPCVKRRKKGRLPSKETRCKSWSNSLGESIVGGSGFTTSSLTSLSSSAHALQELHRGNIFTLDELSKATRNFSPTCKIGQGGFGAVYKGTLEDGTVVAIKRAKKKAYDARISTEFENELGMLLNVDHLNLVKLIGYLEENDERILVVEYIPNGNLREHLDGVHGVVLDLAMRLDICIDVAHALTYLHLYAGKPIVHRDVKPSNILLTQNFRAKVADFGYSRMGPLEIGETHVSTQVKGTVGYLDPEYLKKFQLTEKSDVYSFGVLLVEIMTGRRPIDEKKSMNERVTVRWAFRKFLDGKVIEILDPRLEKSNASGMVVERILEIAIQCAAPTKQDRPCMNNVAERLWDIRKEYQNLLQETRHSSLSELESTSMGRLSLELKLKGSSLKVNERIESDKR